MIDKNKKPKCTKCPFYVPWAEDIKKQESHHCKHGLKPRKEIQESNDSYGYRHCMEEAVLLTIQAMNDERFRGKRYEVTEKQMELVEWYKKIEN